MAKERMLNTRIWNDTWVSKLDPVEKLLFVYFLTNEHTNISGIYELPLKIAAIETGIDPSMFEKIIPRMAPKIHFVEGWIIMTNFPKYQNTENPKIMAGIMRELENVPPHIYKLSITYGYPIALNLTKPNLTKPNGASKEFDPLGAEIIKAFEGVDPKNKNYYGNATQRSACDFLLREYGLDMVLKRISVLPQTNKLPYFPSIMTPVQLRDKWVQLQSAVDRKRSDIASKKVKII